MDEFQSPRQSLCLRRQVAAYNIMSSYCPTLLPDCDAGVTRRTVRPKYLGLLYIRSLLEVLTAFM